MAKKNSSTLKGQAVLIKDETQESANTAARVGGALEDLTDSVTLDYDAGRIYSAGHTVLFSDGLIYRCVTPTLAGQSPSTHPAKWETALVTNPAQIVETGPEKPVSARAVARKLTELETGGDVPMANETRAGKVTRATEEEAMEGEDVAKYITPYLLNAVLAEILKITLIEPQEGDQIVIRQDGDEGFRATNQRPGSVAAATLQAVLQAGNKSSLGLTAGSLNARGAEAYIQLLNAAETVMGYLGFDGARIQLRHARSLVGLLLDEPGNVTLVGLLNHTNVPTIFDPAGLAAYFPGPTGLAQGVLSVGRLRELLSLGTQSPQKGDDYSLPTGQVGTPYNYQTPAGAYTEPDGDPESYRALSGLPPGLLLSSSGHYSGTPTRGGSYEVEIEISDGKGGVLIDTKTLIVNDPDNEAPRQNDAVSMAPLTGTVGELVSYPIEQVPQGWPFIDPEGQPMTYAVAANDLGLAVNAAGTHIEGTLLKVYEGGLTLSATDTGGLSAVRVIAVSIKAGQGLVSAVRLEYDVQSRGLKVRLDTLASGLSVAISRPDNQFFRGHNSLTGVDDGPWSSGSSPDKFRPAVASASAPFDTLNHFNPEQGGVGGVEPGAAHLLHIRGADGSVVLVTFSATDGIQTIAVGSSTPPPPPSGDVAGYIQEVWWKREAATGSGGELRMRVRTLANEGSQWRFASQSAFTALTNGADWDETAPFDESADPRPVLFRYPNSPNALQLTLPMGGPSGGPMGVSDWERLYPAITPEGQYSGTMTGLYQSDTSFLDIEVVSYDAALRRATIRDRAAGAGVAQGQEIKVRINGHDEMPAALGDRVIPAGVPITIQKLAVDSGRPWWEQIHMNNIRRQAETRFILH